MERLTVRTSELRTGDVVLAHGMRCLIDGEMRVTEYGDRAVHYYAALVLNRDEVPNERVPVSWTRDWQRNGRPAANGEHRWTIQGNDLAQWYIEREVA